MQAQHNFAILVDSGRGLPKRDPVEATEWFRRAAEQGDDHAQLSYGTRLYMGNGTARSERDAEIWYKKAAAAKTNQSPHAHLMLGQLYEHQDDLKRAAVHYKMAASKGDSTASMLLGRLRAKTGADSTTKAPSKPGL